MVIKREFTKESTNNGQKTASSRGIQSDQRSETFAGNPRDRMTSQIYTENALNSVWRAAKQFSTPAVMTESLQSRATKHVINIIDRAATGKPTLTSKPYTRSTSNKRQLTDYSEWKVYIVKLHDHPSKRTDIRAKIPFIVVACALGIAATIATYYGLVAIESYFADDASAKTSTLDKEWEPEQKSTSQDAWSEIVIDMTP